MTNEQLRSALRELNAERDLTVVLVNVHSSHWPGQNMLTIRRAMLIPDEDDHLIKVTDGKSIYIIDAEKVAWLSIG
ncbi:MAG: hypothetical protein SFZ24_12345 [Planctomycetota bacterium]|nr:hypothetical protein [Planctomycetota bacterium]